MYRIRIHGRGGQGIKMASRILGSALFRSGFTVQDAPKYGAERRGAPIFATVRAARTKEPGQAINERGIIHRPDLVVVADDTLLATPAAGTLLGIDSGSVVLVNSHVQAETWSERLNLDATLLILPADEQVEDRAELPHIGATCAGAAACLLGVVEPEALAAAITQELAGLGETVVEKNRSSALAAFTAMADQRGVVREGTAITAEGFTPPSWVELPFEDASISAPAIRAAANSVQVRTGLWRTLRPVIDYDHCGKCWWVCSTLCPDSAILVDNGVPVIDYDHCKGCMICVGVCPPHAIAGIPEYLAQEQDALETEGGESDGPDTADR
jgi:pyruvate ferredoxin oxidoreductase gamma subunit